MRLSREIRAYLGGSRRDGGTRNSWAGAPAGDWGDAFISLRAVVEGPVDPLTGFLCNIKDMDAALGEALPLLRVNRERKGGPMDALGALLSVAEPIASRLPKALALIALEIAPSPHTRWARVLSEPTMIRLTQAFEFSASHRLYCPALSEAKNLELFGKCANPNGHGHNYLLEVTVGGDADARLGQCVGLERLNAVVRREIIDVYDHKHLNLDCSDFADLNPTMENICRVIYRRLSSELPEIRLVSIKVWETPKTWAEYDGSSDRPDP